MKSKALIIILFLHCIFLSKVIADTDVKTIQSKLTEATIFLQGAELSHAAPVTLSKGYNEFIIEGLSPNIDRNSLKISSSNKSAVISSFEFSANDIPLKTPDESRIKVLTDSIELISEQIEKIKAEIKIDNELTQLMKKGTDRNVSDTININDLMKTMEYYQTKAREIESRQIFNRNKQKKLESLLATLNRNLGSASTKEFEKSGVLRISCTSPLASTSTFTISYYTDAAQWIPYYDINVVSTDKPIKITAKAKVRQTTTVNWDRVKLTLSTSSPSNGKVAPLFSAWFLQEVVSHVNYAAPAVQNALSYNNNYSRSQERKSESIHYSAAAPLYIVDDVEVDESAFQALDPNTIKDIQVLKDASASAIYGARGSSGIVMATTKSSMDDYITTQENDLNLTFNIDLPYSIPGDGKEQSIELNTRETLADYKYYCAPKLDRETYLIAEIPGWEKLNLLSGKANITYDGTYIGETYINAASTQENLSLTLGADKRVSVKRELVKDFSSSKFMGNDVKQVFTYKMTVKNNQNKTIKMILKDQYPKSTNKEIEVELLLKDTTNPTFNKEDVGVLTWEEELKAGELKIYQISYSVKYPKGKKLNL